MGLSLQNLIDLDNLTGKLKQAYDYWDIKQYHDQLPFRSDIDPIEIIKILPNVELLNIMRNDQDEIIDFQYDLIGGNIDNHTRANRYHQRLSEIPHQDASTNLYKCMKLAADYRHAVALRMEYMGFDIRINHAEGVILPLAGKKDKAESLLMAVTFIEKDHFHRNKE